MIKDRRAKIEEILETIQQGVCEPDLFGPEKLRPYRSLLGTRVSAPSLTDFLAQQANLRSLYETLAAWGMNSRGARLKPFEAFKASVLSCSDDLLRLEEACAPGQHDFVGAVCAVHERLDVMASSSTFVSNAKLLHFLFPLHLMPVDREHTLNYLYGNNANVPKGAYRDGINVQRKVLGRDIDWQKHLDRFWNTTAPKLVDNAIIVLWRRQKQDRRMARAGL